MIDIFYNNIFILLIDGSIVYEEMNLLKYLPTIGPHKSFLYNMVSRNVNFPNTGDSNDMVCICQ